MTNLPWGFRLRIAGDIMRKVIPITSNDRPASFASILERGLGRTICQEFYFPYAKKIWGLPPEELSPIQAHRRVSAGSIGKMLKNVFIDGIRSSGAKRCFFYPRGGFGQIARAMATEACKAGVDIHYQTAIRAIHLGPPHSIELGQNGQIKSIQADYMWSTIPVPVFLGLIRPAVPSIVLEASSLIRYRRMILIYLILGQTRFSEYDAHYFPGPEALLTRLSEPKNYSACTDPSDRTILCGELPCDENDEIWRMSNKELANIVSQSLIQYELPIDSPVLSVTKRRLTHAYPIYHRGYEEHFRVIDQWLGGLDGVLSFGRQGLFTHDNIHHTLAMAYAAVDCLNQEGVFNRDKWYAYRQVFDNHVVED
jgi:protoporphyrinogen oxidase